MSLEIVTIPCLSDNYAYLIHEPETGTTALVDAPEAFPIQRELEARGWQLDLVLITHHHFDHVEGLEELRERYAPVVVGAKADAERLPKLDIAVVEGDEVRVGEAVATVLEVYGHTIGHIAYHFPAEKAVFTADSLMAAGCGRVFEGTFDQMWDSLSKFTDMPHDTQVYSGHEYTAANIKFALTVDGNNPVLKARAEEVATLRAGGEPTVPSSIGDELATNPFLRAMAPEVKDGLGMAGAPDAEVFAEIRQRKDSF